MLPKPLLPVGGIPMIKVALDSLLPNPNPQDYKLIFIVRQDHCVNNDIGNALRRLFKGWRIEVMALNEMTQGTLCTCVTAKDLIDEDAPLIVYTPDVCFESDFDLAADFVDSDRDGMLLTFKANSTDHSYVAIDDDGLAIKTAEKVVISNDAIVGVYCYRSGKQFIEYANKAIETGIKTNNEFYVAPMYNLLIEDGAKIGVKRVDKMYVLGTPEDLDFYETHVLKFKNVGQFAVCCDHSGFSLKESLLDVLSDTGLKVVDFGTHSCRDSDHYDTLKPCVEYLVTRSQVIGIGICSTGQGFNIAANKAKGIRSVLVANAHFAAMGRRHNAANFFCIPSMLITPNMLSEIINAIIANSFDGGRHATRIQKVENDAYFIK